jgi:NAD(P)-dependent dehydrogenase (short-subunit alcohol dehydrogenase family)
VTARVVCVTGAAQGVGYATAHLFAKRGDVVIATSRDADRTRAAFANHGSGIVAHELDVTDQQSVDRLHAFVAERYGRLDVLVNNAGQGFRGTLEQLSIDDLSASLEVNFLGPARMTKAFWPMMRQARSGRLIAISSIAGVIGQPFQDAYCAAKFALEGLYESLRPVAAMWNVAVSIVEPGPIASEFDARALIAHTADDAELSQIENRYLAVVGTGRPRSPAEAAEVVLDCADDPQPKLRYQTGRLAAHLVGLKLADVTGEVISSMTTGWLTAEPTAPAAPAQANA